MEEVKLNPQVTPDTMRMSDGTGMTDAERVAAKSFGWMGLISHRATIQEAYDYGIATANSCCKRDKAAMLVVIQLIINTYAIKLAKGEFRDAHQSTDLRGRRSGKGTMLKIIQLLQDAGIDAEVDLVRDFVVSNPAIEILDRLQEHFIPTRATEPPAEIRKEALEESVSRLLKKVGKLQVQLMDKVGSENVILDDVKMLAEIEHLTRTNKELGAELARMKLYCQHLHDFKLSSEGVMAQIKQLKQENSKLKATNADLQETINITQIWEHRALKAEKALMDLGITYQKLTKSPSDEPDIALRIRNLEETVGQLFPAQIAATEKLIKQIGGQVEDLELRLSKGGGKPYPGHTDFDPTK